MGEERHDSFPRCFGSDLPGCCKHSGVAGQFEFRGRLLRAKWDGDLSERGGDVWKYGPQHFPWAGFCGLGWIGEQDMETYRAAEAADACGAFQCVESSDFRGWVGS